MKLLIGLPQQSDKLVFSALTPNFLSLRTSPQTGVAIPLLEGKCTDKQPKTGVPAIFGGNRYLVPFNRGIATTSVRTGLAMTAFTRQTPTCRILQERIIVNCQLSIVNSNNQTTSNLYPTPQTVFRPQLSLTPSSFSRRRLTWTSTVRESPK